jgi:glucan biosynthesis protein C
MQRRIHYMDWLRVLAVLLLFPFHTSRVFNAGEPFYVKSASLLPALNPVLGFIDRWHMPLLFLLAGASTYLALGKRSGGAYVGERMKRLLVPLVFGILVIMPPQTWVGAQYNSRYTDSFWHYLSSGEFLRFNIQDAGDYFGGLGIGHLWFILFLLLISLVALPLLLWARGERGHERLARFARRIAHPAWWLLPAFLILLGEAFPEFAGKNIVYDAVFFVLGFVIMADPAFAASAERARWWALGTGAVLCVFWLFTGPLRDSLPDPSLPLFGLNYCGMLGIWLSIVGFLGLGRRFLDRPSPALRYLSEASYPLYILHQTVIVVAAFYIVRLPVAGPLKWLALLCAAVAVTFALYEGVRRVSALRFLFGMRPKARETAPAAA